MAHRHPQYRREIEAARRPAHALEGELADAVGLPIADLVEELRRAWQSQVGERTTG